MDALGVAKVLDLLKELFGLKIVKKLIVQKNENRETFWKIFWQKDLGFTFGEVRDYFLRIFLWMDQQFQDADEFEVLEDERRPLETPKRRRKRVDSTESGESEPIEDEDDEEATEARSLTRQGSVKAKGQLRESPSLRTLQKLALEKVLRQSKFPEEIFGVRDKFLALTNDAPFHFDILKVVNQEFEFGDERHIDSLVALYLLENFDKPGTAQLILYMLGTKTFPQITEKLNAHVKELKGPENLRVYAHELETIALHSEHPELFRFGVEHKQIFIFIVECLFGYLRGVEAGEETTRMLHMRDEHGNTLLHVFSQFYRLFRDTYVDRVKFLATKFTSAAEFEDFLRLQNADGKLFLHFAEDKDIFDELLRFLHAHCSENFLRDFLFAKDKLGNTFLYYGISCAHCEIDQCLATVRDLLGLDYLKQLLSQLNKKAQNFLFYFRYGNAFYESNLMRSLNFIYGCYPTDARLFHLLLNKKDKSDVKFLNHFRNKLENKDANKIPRWLAQRFDRKTVDQILGIRKTITPVTAVRKVPAKK